MASSAAISSHHANAIGEAFVEQYYQIMHRSPEQLHMFYLDSSKLGRPGLDGVMSTTTTIQAIKDKIASLDHEYSQIEISTVDAQDSNDGGILISVTGYLTGKDCLTRQFSQIFFLAPQDNSGYFVLNDVFRYIGDDEHSIETKTRVDNVVPATDLPSKKNHIEEQDGNSEKANNPSENVSVSIFMRSWKLCIACLLCGD